MKWPRLAPHSRASLADALATVTLALTRPASGRPSARTLRAALYRHAFNPTRRATTTDPAVARALGLAGAGLTARHPAQRPAGHPGRARCADAAAGRQPRRSEHHRPQARSVPRRRWDTRSRLGLLPANPVRPGAAGHAPKAAAASTRRSWPAPPRCGRCWRAVARTPPGADRVLRLPVLRRAAPRRSRRPAQRRLPPGPARVGHADPHRRRPAPPPPGPATAPATNRAASSTGRTERSGSSRSRRSWSPAPRSTCGHTAPRRTGGCSAEPAAARSAKAPTAAPGTPPATIALGPQLAATAWPAAPTTCGTPPCRCG